MNSVWVENIEPVRFEPLKGSAKTDVLIIGGGIAGILCAHMLKKAGVDCILVEADRICGGITKNTTAKITVQHGLIYHKMIERFGIERTRLYLEAQKQAFEEYARLAQEIPCDFAVRDSYVYSVSDRAKIERELASFERLRMKAEFSDASALPMTVAGAVCVKGQAEFHPLKFLYGLAKELPIYENTKVVALKPRVATTQYGEIRCRKMIVATHFPILNKHGGYFLKLYQHRSYVLALEGALDVGGMYIDENESGLSFRNYKNLLLLGGGSHRTGKKGGNWRELEAFAGEKLCNARVVYRWATQDCMTLDHIPYIGQYAKNTPDLFVATGFNKWGMTSAMASASLLSDLVRGKRNTFAEVFSPSRSILHPQLAVNAFESLVGILTPTVPRCPHLGCALKYNAAEHSWDCPCHGSRFTESGELIDNPATDDKRK